MEQVEHGLAGNRAALARRWGFGMRLAANESCFSGRLISRAIATEPEIIFFDEPTTGLDPIMADVINELIVKCVKELGATALSITHDMASARKIADRIAMIWEGKIIWHGPVSEIDHSGNPYVDQFIHGRADGPIKMQIREL